MIWVYEKTFEDEGLDVSYYPILEIEAGVSDLEDMIEVISFEFGLYNRKRDV